MLPVTDTPKDENVQVQWWLVLPSWERLHYPAPGKVEWWKGEEPGYFGDGKTICGREGQLTMPGVISRLGLPRCAHCCDRLGVPRGNGDPINNHSSVDDEAGLK